MLTQMTECRECSDYRIGWADDVRLAAETGEPQ